MKERNDIRRVEYTDIKNFPIGEMVIEETVRLDSIPEDSIVYITNISKQIGSTLIKLQSSSIAELFFFMSLDSFFNISVSKDYCGFEKYEELKKRHDNAKALSRLVYTKGNIISSVDGNLAISSFFFEEDTNKSNLTNLADQSLKDLKDFFYEDYEYLMSYVEDMSFILKMDSDKWNEFDESIKSQMLKDHSLKEEKDKIELYSKNFSFTVD